jgi:integrase
VKDDAKKERKKKFEFVAVGLARKGNLIYARIKLGKKWTWRSTKTNDAELARLWKANWDKKSWLENQGFVQKEPESQLQKLPSQEEKAHPKENSPPKEVSVNDILDSYVKEGHPTVKKGKIRRKAQRTIENETYIIPRLRQHFGEMIAETVSLGDCAKYEEWRRNGGYVAQYTCRGKAMKKVTKGGDRTVDVDLGVFSNALALAVRNGILKANPIANRGRYKDDATIRHCREVAPTPDGLVKIVRWLRKNGYVQDADQTEFHAYSGLRLSEALRGVWPQVDWDDDLLHVKRSKRGIVPFVPLLPELRRLLRRMKRTATGNLLFPSPFNSAVPRDGSAFRRRLAQAAKACHLPHVTPQGLRSYFVTQARQSGLTDAEIAQLIGDATGPELISEVYGDVRPDHLLSIARKIRLTARTRAGRSSSKRGNRRKKEH